MLNVQTLLYLGTFFCLIVFNAFIKADLYFKQETSGPSHDGISVLRIRWCSLSVKMIWALQVKQKLRGRGNSQSDSSASKVVIRFCEWFIFEDFVRWITKFNSITDKETAGSGGTHNYLIQFNAGGHWASDHSVVLLVSDIFQPFGVQLGDVQVRQESSLYSVSNTNTFPGRRIDIQMLLAKVIWKTPCLQVRHICFAVIYCKLNCFTISLKRLDMAEQNCLGRLVESAWNLGIHR